MTNHKEDREDGGHAFPCAGNPDCEQFMPGMSLRDWFAGMALQGMLAGLFSEQYQPAPFNKCAEDAYKYADAMISERIIKNDQQI